jgi:hypothetical protein
MVGWCRCGFWKFGKEWIPLPRGHILGHAVPEESGGNKAACDTYAWLTKGMNVVENLLAKGKREMRGRKVFMEMSPRREKGQEKEE